MKKVLFSKCGFMTLAFFFCLISRVAAQDCNFTITTDVQNSSCLANGIISVQLEDTAGKRISNMRYSLDPIVAGASQSTNNVLTSIPPGTYKVIVDAMCSVSGAPVQVQEVLENVVVANEYTRPTVTRVEGTFTSGHLYGSVPSLPCANTGVAQIRIQNGVFPFTVVVFHNGDTLTTEVFEQPMYTGTGLTRYDFREYYTFSGLAPGSYTFQVTDACGTSERVSGVNITQLTRSFDIDQSVIYRGPASINDDVTFRFALFYRLNLSADLYYYYYMHTQNINPWWEFSYKIGDDGTYSEWNTIGRNGEESITLPLNGYCEIYDSTQNRKNNIFIRVRAIGCTDPVYDQEKPFLIRKPGNSSIRNYIKYATDSSIYHPVEYYPCYYINPYTTQYQRSEFLSLAADTFAVYGTSVEANMYYSPPLLVQAFNKDADTLMVERNFNAYRWECDIPLTPELNGSIARVIVTDRHGCTVFERDFTLEYKFQTTGTIPPIQRYEWRPTSNSGDLCGNTMKNISIFRFPYENLNPFSYLQGTTIRLIESPDANLQNFTAVFDTTPPMDWKFTTTEGFPSNASLRSNVSGNSAYFFLESMDLVTGNYIFEITSDCNIDTIPVNYTSQDTLTISEEPRYDLITDCESFKVVPRAGQIKKESEDYQTYFRIMSGPQGGYSPMDYVLNDTIELTMTGTYVIQMYAPNVDMRCVTRRDTIVYERNPLRYAYLHAYVCTATDQTAKVKVTGQDGTIPYQYVVYSQPDGRGSVLATGTQGDFASVNARLGDVLSVRVSDFCGTRYLTNIEVINLETARIAWFANNNSKELDICQGDSVFMDGLSLGDVTYRWLGPEGFIDTLKEVICIPRNIDKTGWYHLEVGNTHCTSVQDSIYLRVHNRPTAVLSGTDTVCQNGTGNLTITLTGAAPWTVVTSNDEILEISITETTNGTYTWRPDISLTANTNFSLVSVSDSLCTGEVSGMGELVMRTPVTATLSGDDTICSGETTNLQIELTGVSPWQVVAGNGDTLNISTGDLNNNIYTWNPQNILEGTNFLTLTSVVDHDCPGTVSGLALLYLKTPPSFINCPDDDYSVNTQTDSCSALVNYPIGINGNPAPVVSFIITDEGNQIVAGGAGTGVGIRLNKGAYNVIINAENDCGESQCSFPLIITDHQGPQVRCPSAYDMATDSSKNYYTVKGDEFQPTNAWDNCPDYTIINDYNNSASLTGEVFPLGNTTVQWTITDASGNTSSCRFIVEIKDKEAPVIGDTTDNPGAISCTTIGDQIVSVDTNSRGYLHTGTNWDVTATDNVGVDSIWYVLTGSTVNSGTSLDNVLFNMGNTTVTWNATDTSGNRAFCSFLVTVRDSIPPVIGDTTDNPGAISCMTIGDQILSTASDSNVYIHQGKDWDVTATDNIGVDSLWYVLSGVTTGNGITLNNVAFNMGTTTVTWTATDTSGNRATCTFNVTINDSIPPVIGDTTGGNPGAISCETIGNRIVSTDSTTNIYEHKNTTWDVTATDNVGVDSLWYVLTGATTGSGVTLQNVLFNMGTTTVMWTATDTSGNIANCSFNVTVNDSIPPVIGDTTGGNPNPISCETIGNQIVSTAADTNVYIHTGINWDVTATDNVMLDLLWYDLTGATTGTGNTLDGIAFNIGTTTVTWNATDTSGNLATCSFRVSIGDSIPPVIGDTTVPGAISCETIGNQLLYVPSDTNVYIHSGTNWDVTATDNVGVERIWYELTGQTTGTGSTLNNITFNMGNTTVTWYATDTSGNIANCDFMVMIRDTVPPVIGDTTGGNPGAISCLTIGDQVLSTDSTTNTYEHLTTNWDVTATDNVGVDSIWYMLTGATTGNGTTLQNKIFNMGTTTVTWTATDTSGNIANCSFNVTINDSIPPVIGDTTDGDPNPVSCETIGNQIVYVQADTNIYTHNSTDWNITATDNVMVDRIWYELNGATQKRGASLEDVSFNIGFTNVQWFVTDTSDNMATCNFTVEVRDTIPPVIGDSTEINPNPISCLTIGDPLLCVESTVGFYVHPDSSWNVTATDNDSIASIMYYLSGATTGSGTTLEGQRFEEGLTNVLWIVTDRSGNIDSCSFDVSINIIPEVRLSGNATIRENDHAPLTLEFTGNLPITIYHTITGSGDTNMYVIPDTAVSPHTWLLECQQSGTYELVGVEMETPCDVNFSGAASVIISECLDERVIVMECPDNILRTLPYGECSVKIDLTVPFTQYEGDTIEGNNPNIIITNNAPQGNIFTPGIHTITWIATDACDFADTCTHLVVINESPCGINDTIWSIDGSVDSIANIIAIDSEGNEYSTVRINCDCWTGQNITSKQFSDDASVLSARTRAAAVIPQRYIYYAKAYPDVDANELKYGGLYNWHAASKMGTVNARGLVQGICPNGWVLPSVDKYEGLIVFGSDDLRQPNEWMQDNTALNGSGFSALPAGFFNSSTNNYYYLMGDAYFWTAAEGDIGKVAHIRYLCPIITIEDMDKNHGASVRCIKANDDDTLTAGE